MCRIPPKRISWELEWARDPERNPMTWNSSNTGDLHAVGLGCPSADHRTVNVEVEKGDGASIFNLYRRLIALRREHSVLVSGVLRSVTTSGHLQSYERATDNERLLVLNFCHILFRRLRRRASLSELTLNAAAFHTIAVLACGFFSPSSSKTFFIPGNKRVGDA